MVYLDLTGKSGHKSICNTIVICTEDHRITAFHLEGKLIEMVRDFSIFQCDIGLLYFIYCPAACLLKLRCRSEDISLNIQCKAAIIHYEFFAAVNVISNASGNSDIYLDATVRRRQTLNCLCIKLRSTTKAHQRNGKNRN